LQALLNIQLLLPLRKNKSQNLRAQKRHSTRGGH
jgi:hypothetical protein